MSSLLNKLITNSFILRTWYFWQLGFDIEFTICCFGIWKII